MGYSPFFFNPCRAGDTPAYFAVQSINNLEFCFLAIAAVRIAIIKRRNQAKIRTHKPVSVCLTHKTKQIII